MNRKIALISALIGWCLLIAEGYLERDSQLSPLLTKAVKGLEKIKSRGWYDPTKEQGACVADCDAGLPQGTPHLEHCPFQMAKEVLKELAQAGEGL